MEIWVINGPNLNLLGVREPAIYGRTDYDTLCAGLAAAAKEEGVTLRCLQSNHEGALVDWIQEAYGKADGLILNPGAYTHTSIALLDALCAVGLPTVEVHISDPDAREEFRRISYVRRACFATVKGRGVAGYGEALHLLCAHLRAGNG